MSRAAPDSSELLAVRWQNLLLGHEAAMSVLDVQPPGSVSSMKAFTLGVLLTSMSQVRLPLKSRYPRVRHPHPRRRAVHPGAVAGPDDPVVLNGVPLAAGVADEIFQPGPQLPTHTAEQRAGGAAPVPLHHPDARQRLPAGPDDALEREAAGAGRAQAARDWLRQGRQKGGSLGALRYAQAKQQGGPDLLPSSLSPAATSASVSSLRCRFLAQSAEHYSQALALCLGDQRGVARACARLGSARHLLGEHRAAADCHSERLAVAIATGDVETEMLARRDLGNASVVLGDLAAAAQQFELCLQLARAAPDQPALEAQACWLLGNARTLLRDYPAAVANHERHLDIADRLGDKLGASQACLSLCNAFSSLGDYARAAHFAKRRQHLCEQLGDRAGAESAKLSLVDLRRLLRRPNDADVDYDDTSGPAPAAAQSSSRRASLGAAGHSGKDSRQRSGRPTAAAGKEAADNYNDDDDDDDVDEVSRRQQAAFWDLVSRCQGRRMDDQRASPPLLPMEAAGAGVIFRRSHRRRRRLCPDSDAFASMARQSQEQRRQRGRTASLLSRLSLRRRAGRG
uniref:TPR_REGION domain-containing protein n=1 Tax=Macrostomum lignano TaxID=282301 RepID=A0A1I8FTM9_9PLAT